MLVMVRVVWKDSAKRVVGLVLIFSDKGALKVQTAFAAHGHE
jgi:hypothetical protein